VAKALLPDGFTQFRLPEDLGWLTSLTVTLVASDGGAIPAGVTLSFVNRLNLVVKPTWNNTKKILTIPVPILSTVEMGSTDVSLATIAGVEVVGSLTGAKAMTVLVHWKLATTRNRLTLAAGPAMEWGSVLRLRT
jgi:hypothetical protein